jgi:MRG-binding protein
MFTGMHKHFRMISIANALQSHGYSYNSSSGPHTRIPGIWAKLHSLYDLDALDERENRHAGDITPDPLSTNDEQMEEDGSENGSGWTEFTLDEDEYGELMWEKRFDRHGSGGRQSRRDSSPEIIEGLNRTRPVPGVHLAAAEAEDTASVKGKGKKSTTMSSKAKAKGTRSTPAEEPEEEDDEGDDDDESTPAGSPPSRGATKASKKGKVASGSRRSKRKR